MDFLVPPAKRFIADGPPAAAFPPEFSFRAAGKGSRPAAGYLAGELGRELSVRGRPARGRPPDLSVEVRRGLLRDVGGLPRERAIRQQAYRLVWRPGREVSIRAEGAAGALHGAATLRQILAAQSEGLPVPAGIIEDWPALRWRGLQDDLARGRVFDMEHARRQIRRLAAMKGNLYQLYLETRFAFPRRPDVAPPGSMTPDQARELEAWAAALGVTLLPQVNTFGHLELLLAREQYRHLREDPDDPQYICPLHPETRPLLKDLLDDVMDAFASPLIPVGLDEVMVIGRCERCRGRDPGEIFAEHARWLHSVVSARGRTMLMWHDMLLDRVEFAGSVANGPHQWAERALESLPRDIVICDWQYRNSADTTAHFTAKGFAALACNATYGPIAREFPFDFSAAWHTSRLYAAARRAGAAGAIQTTWGDVGHGGFGNWWLLYAHSLSTAWEPAQRVRLRRFAESWGRLEMGLDGRAYEDLIARMSVPLFGGTGLRSVTVEGTQERCALGPARAWWRAVSPRLVAAERRFNDDLERRLEALRAAAGRGRDLLDLLDYPLLVRRLHADQAWRVGRAARLHERALAPGAGEPLARRLLARAAEMLRAHAGELSRLEPALRRLAAAEGVAEEVFEKAAAHRRDLLARAERLAAAADGAAPPPFEEVFWSTAESPYER